MFRTQFCFYLLVLAYLFTRPIESTNHDLEEPFLFPFGPAHNDTFNPKISDHCSSYQNLTYPLKFGNVTFSPGGLSVCMHGYVILASPIDTVFISPFYLGIDTNDQFFDQMCNYNYNDGFYNYYYENGNFENNFAEKACVLWRANTTVNFTLNFNENYIYNETIRNKIIEWEEKTFTASTFDLFYDDYISRLVFGKQTTKYVNLANNIFKRELGSSDKILARELIREKIDNFTTDWGFVATWYKVGRSNRVDAFNSFQATILCGFVDAVKRCFVMFDYFQLEWLLWDFRDIFADAGFQNEKGMS